MLNLSLSAIPKGGGGLPIENPNKVSSFNSSVPSSILFTGRRSAISVGPHGKIFKDISFRVQSQYSSRQDQQQRWSSYDSPPPSQPGQQPPKVYVGHSIYKGKAALTVEPRSPEFSALDSGAFKLSKEGFVLLQFAPASGVRQYDWGRKQIFSLSVTEIGNIMSLGARDSCEFFHDPFKGKSEEGKVRKVLKVEPLPDGSGHFFNLSKILVPLKTIGVQNKLINSDENIYIPISKAEFAVLVSSFNFIVPYLLGWHTFASFIRPEDANTRSVADFEWNR